MGRDVTDLMASGDGALVARLHGIRDVRVDREALPTPGPGEVLLRVGAVGICGSDLHWYEDAAIGDAKLTRPVVPGHEFAGRVASGPRTGERVVGDPADPCGACRQCDDGASHLCQRMRFSGHGDTDGSLRTFMAWPSQRLHAIPDAISDDDAPVLETAAVAIHAVALAPRDSWAGASVMGCGPLGLLIVQLLRDAGVPRIIATDRLEHRVAAATVMGATESYQVDPDPIATEPAAAIDPDSVDVAFEVSGTDAGLADALIAVRPGGTVVLVGIPADDRTSFRAATVRRKGLTLVACRRSRPRDVASAIDLASSGRIDLGSVVSDRFPILEAARAFAVASDRRGLKVVIRP